MKRILIILSILFHLSLFASSSSLSVLHKQDSNIYEGDTGGLFFLIDDQTYKGKTFTDNELEDIFNNKKKDICDNSYRDYYKDKDTVIQGLINIFIAENKTLLIYSTGCGSEEFHKMKIMDKDTGVYKTMLNKTGFFLTIGESVPKDDEINYQQYVLSQMNIYATNSAFCSPLATKESLSVFFIMHGIGDKSFIKFINCGE